MPRRPMRNGSLTRFRRKTRPQSGGLAPWAILSTLYSDFCSSGLWAPTPSPATGCEGIVTMIEPIIGLIVGLSLGAYLLYTLIHPEKF